MPPILRVGGVDVHPIGENHHIGPHGNELCLPRLQPQGDVGVSDDEVAAVGVAELIFGKQPPDVAAAGDKPPLPPGGEQGVVVPGDVFHVVKSPIGAAQTVIVPTKGRNHLLPAAQGP